MLYLFNAKLSIVALSVLNLRRLIRIPHILIARVQSN